MGCGGSVAARVRDWLQEGPTDVHRVAVKLPMRGTCADEFGETSAGSCSAESADTQAWAQRALARYAAICETDEAADSTPPKPPVLSRCAPCSWPSEPHRGGGGRRLVAGGKNDFGPCGPEALDDATLERLSVPRGSYRMLRLLDSTANAEVWLAEWRTGGGQIAVKSVDKPSTAQPMAMHVNEARVLDRLVHPCLLELFGIIDTPTRFEMLLEYCPGGSLRRYFQSYAGHDWPQLLLDLASALDYMHAEYFAHLDVKPDNLLVSSGRGRLCDFGTSTSLGPSRLLKAQVGTPGYKAPEIEMGDWFDAQLADVWSLGRVVEFVGGCINGNWPDIRPLLDRHPARRPRAADCIGILRGLAADYSSH